MATGTPTPELATPSDRRSTGLVAAIVAGVIVGAVESVLAIAFAALVFGGLLAHRLGDGIGLYLLAAALTLAILAWRGGARGVVGSVQDAAAAVLGVVAGSTAAKATQIQQVARAAGLKNFELPDVFLTVVAATLIVTVLCGVVFFTLGALRLGNLVRFVPYPVVGGFLAGTGWLLLKGGIYVSSGLQLAIAQGRDPLVTRLGTTMHTLTRSYTLQRLVPAFLFGVILLVAVRTIHRPLVIPVVLALGIVAFAVGMLITGSSVGDARAGGWLLGPLDTGAKLWQPWTLRSLGGADWPSVISQWAKMASAILVASLAILFNINGTEVVLRRDLDTNRELRDAGVLNVLSGALGGIPGYHALSLTALVDRMSVDARVAGLVGAVVPLAAVVFGAQIVELIPRMIVGGVLVFLGLAFLVEWLWDKRKVLPRIEYVVVLVIVAGIVVKGFLPGVALGLVLAVVLFAVNYGRIEQVREVAFGQTHRSNVDRSAAERRMLRERGGDVQVLLLDGFLFFGSANGLLERVRRRVASSPPRALVLDLRSVSGMDTSAAIAFRKLARIAEDHGFELVLAGASDAVREELARADVVEREGIVAFVPDLDRGLQRVEDRLLADAAPEGASSDDEAPVAMPAALRPFLERRELAQGEVLIRQHERPTDVFVLQSGRLQVEAETAAGTRMRLGTIRPGVVVGEVAMYTGDERTADVVAETPVVVLRLTAERLAMLEREQPDLAADVHRWLATTLAERLTETLATFDALVD